MPILDIYFPYITQVTQPNSLSLKLIYNMATAVASAVALAITFIFLALIAAVPNVAFEDYITYSDPPQSLLPGQSLTYDMTPHGLPYGPHELAFGHHCNLVLYAYGERTWSTNTSLKDGQNCYLTLLPDGELVLRNDIHYPVWSSGTKSTPGNYAFLMNVFGQLNIYGPELWTNTDKVTLSDPNPATTSTDFIFYGGEYRMATFGKMLEYKNFRVVLRQDCNLVLEDTNSRDVLWETGTNSTSGDCFAMLDTYGELFVKHKRREVLWRSEKRTTAEGHGCLVLRYDGRLVIYSRRIWAQPPNVYVPPTMCVTCRD